VTLVGGDPRRVSGVTEVGGGDVDVLEGVLPGALATTPAPEHPPKMNAAATNPAERHRVVIFAKSCML
jgi:hypothetical protein